MRYTGKPRASNCRFRLTCKGRSALPGAFSSMKAIFPLGRSTKRSGTPSNPGLINLGARPPMIRTAFTSLASMAFSRLSASFVPGTEKSLYARICVFRVLMTSISYIFRYIRNVRNTGTRKPVFLAAHGASAVPMGCSGQGSSVRSCPSEPVPEFCAYPSFHLEHPFGTKTYCGP